MKYLFGSLDGQKQYVYSGYDFEPCVWSSKGTGIVAFSHTHSVGDELEAVLSCMTCHICRQTGESPLNCNKRKVVITKTKISYIYYN